MLSHPLSRGSTHITRATGDQDAGSNTGLAIDPGYLSQPLDLELLARYLCVIEGTLARTEPLASLLLAREDLFPDLEAARTYIRRTASGAHHYTSTCAMAPRNRGGVVDERLRIHGCRNLRVFDASVIPLSPRANTQAVVYDFAEHGATIIQDDISKGIL